MFSQSSTSSRASASERPSSPGSAAKVRVEPLLESARIEALHGKHRAAAHRKKRRCGRRLQVSAPAPSVASRLKVRPAGPSERSPKRRLALRPAPRRRRATERLRLPNTPPPPLGPFVETCQSVSSTSFSPSPPQESPAGSLEPQCGSLYRSCCRSSGHNRPGKRCRPTTNADPRAFGRSGRESRRAYTGAR